ncbi:MAG TPA: hypothetical protein VFZ24_11885 [Longimicrobiales bacterium]
MSPGQRPIPTAILALLFALGTMLQQQAALRALPVAECTDADTCVPLEPHQLTPGGAIAAPVAAAARFDIESADPNARAGRESGAAGGVDVLFRARSVLQLVRARAALLEHRSISASLHAAAQSAASAPTRAPPDHS